MNEEYSTKPISASAGVGLNCHLPSSTVPDNISDCSLLYKTEDPKCTSPESFKKKNVLIKHSQHLRFGSLALCGFACACTYARCQAYGTDTNHSAQQTNQLINLALTGLMNLAENFRSTLNTKPDAQRAHHNQHDEQRHTQRM